MSDAMTLILSWTGEDVTDLKGLLEKVRDDPLSFDDDEFYQVCSGLPEAWIAGYDIGYILPVIEGERLIAVDKKGRALSSVPAMWREGWTFLMSRLEGE